MTTSHDRDAAKLESVGLNLHSQGNMYKAFKEYIGFPSFGDYLDKKSKYDEFQFKSLSTIMFGSEHIAQVLTNIKEALVFLNLNGFTQYTWEDFTEFFNNFEKHKVKERALKRVITGDVDIKNYEPNVDLYYNIRPFFFDQSSIFWFWTDEEKKWVMCDEIDIMSDFDKLFKFNGHTIPTSIKNNYLEAMRRFGRTKIPKTAPKSWIQFKSTIIDINSGEEIKPSADYFLCNPLPWDLGENADTPVMDKLFQDWVGEKYVNTLYEIIAYGCLSHYPIHLIFGLIGAGRNGKSQFQKVMQKFLGHSNICSAELDRIASSNNRFESAKLYKKLCCFMSETNFQTMENTSMLKKLTGGDLIDFEFKNKSPFNDYSYAKIVISSNSLPTSGDTSDGFYRRWLIIHFRNEFKEGKDVFASIPDQEYVNLARKVVTVLRHLLAEGTFTNQGTVEERKQQYILASNPLSTFLDQYCDKHPENYITKNQLYNAYCTYLRGIKARVVNRKEFTMALSEEGYYAVNSKRKVSVSHHNKLNEPVYENGYWVDGIQLKDDFTTNTTITTNFQLQSIEENKGNRKGVVNMVNVVKSTLETQKVISSQPKGDELTTKDILFHIERFGGEVGMDIEQLKEDLEVTDEMIDQLKRKGLIYEPKGGHVKVL